MELWKNQLGNKRKRGLRRPEIGYFSCNNHDIIPSTCEKCLVRRKTLEKYLACNEPAQNSKSAASLIFPAGLIKVFFEIFLMIAYYSE
jgi:hypothetical protein